MINLRPLQSGETDLRHIGSWLNKLRDYVEGFSNLHGAGGNTVLWHGNTPTIAYRGSAMGQAGTSTYRGPFAVVNSSTESVVQVRVLGYHADENRNWKNYIDVGLDTPLELAEQDITVSASGYVYLTLTQTAGAYSTPTVSFGGLPAQDNTHYYHRLAYVTYASSAITAITQFQYGCITLPGRIF